jgi:hypothetical protein
VNQPQQRRGSKDVWPLERKGYDKPLPVAYAAMPLKSARPRLPITLEKQIGGLTAAAGAIWAAQAVPGTLMVTPGPLEVCGVGVLLWLHAKWRRALNR